MSELMNMRRTDRGCRRQLLATVSAFALLASAYGADKAQADDQPDHPALWIELGGQFDQLTDGAQNWVPPNLPPRISVPLSEPLGTMPSVGYDFDGAVSFQPNDSDWVYSASIRYGKAKHGPKTIHDQSYKTVQKYYQNFHTNYAFADTTSSSETKHLILDFKAGRDAGLGMFGGHSTINFGIRVTRFTENVDGVLSAFSTAPHKYGDKVERKADAQLARSFSGIGPSISWDGVVPVTGSFNEGLSLDWGANAAFLFGRQKTRNSLRTNNSIGRYYFQSSVPLSHSTATPSRSRQVIVPNVGGFAGMSYHLGGVAKVSFGYRADFFFGAIDGGIAARKTENVGFYGPFANVSVGIGG